MTPATAALIENTKIAITNAQRDLPQFSNDIADMVSDLTKVQNAGLCLCILRNLEAMYEGTYEAI